MSNTTRKRLPDGWCWTTIGEVATTQTGGTPTRTRKDFFQGHIPWVKSGELGDGLVCESEEKISQEAIENSNAKLFPKGTLCIALYGATVGKLGILDIEAATNQAVCAIHLPHSINRRYVYHYLRSVRQSLINQGKGGAQSNISNGIVRVIPFPLAPADEQVRLVDRIEELLSEFDAGVAALKRVQANLKRYRASVLKAAVEGKLTEAWRAEHTPKETGEQLLERILKDRRQKWEADQLAVYEAKGKQPPKNWQARYKEPDAPDTSELPDLPEGWCWASADQLASSEKHSLAIGPFGSNLKVSDYQESGVPLVFVRNIRAGLFGGEHTHFVNLEKANELIAHSIDGGDVLITKMGDPPGDAILYPLNESRAIITADCIKFRPSKILTALHFFVSAINSPLVHTQITKITRGVAQKKVSLGRFSKIALPLPPLSEQHQITLEIESCSSVIEVGKREVNTALKRAARLRQSILKDAFEGKLVAQDSADEPASELLARIKAERDNASHEPKSKQIKPKVLKKITQRRGAIVAYTIAYANHHTTRKSETLGRTKLIKTLYLVQIHEGLDLQFRFQRYAAGPFDEAIFKLEGTANKNDWFNTNDRDNYGVTYHPAEKTNELCEEATTFLGDNKSNIDRLLDHVTKMDMREAELFATTYAAWNDLLIDGKEATDETIIEEFYAWHEEKQKFKRPEILNQLKWMRNEGYVPSGKSERTQPRDKKTKLPSSSKKRRKS